MRNGGLYLEGQPTWGQDAILFGQKKRQFALGIVDLIW
jgi:hypothetical protein